MDGQPFQYTDELVAALIGAMSPTRFATYLRAAGSERAALQLYAWNTAAASAFYGPLQTLEVTLRNAVHGALTAAHGDRWFDDSNVLRTAELRLTGNATQYLYDTGKEPSPGRVVAELPYGFWVALFANAYDATLWRTDLHKLFTPRIKDRHTLYDALDRLRTLRNRIAHHEPIFQRKLADDYRRIRYIVGFLSVPTLAWLDHHSTVSAAISLDPSDIRNF